MDSGCALAPGARHRSVCHPSSKCSRSHVNTGAPKTDRLDTELLKRVFLGWLRGEPITAACLLFPTLEQEDAKRPKPRT